MTHLLQGTPPSPCARCRGISECCLALLPLLPLSAVQGGEVIGVKALFFGFPFFFFSYIGKK